MSILTPRSPRAAGLVVAVLLGLAPAASVMAQAAPSYDTLLERLDQLPGTRVGTALAEAADARRPGPCVAQPSLSYSAENAWGTGSYGGMGKADTVLTLSQPLEVWGQRGARVRAARAEAQAANLRGAQSRSDVASQLAVVYAQAESALRRYTLAEEALSLTRADANAVNAMVKQGREPQLRAVQAQSEVANASAALDEAQAFRDAALARLAGAALLDAPVQSIDNSLLDRAPPLPRGATDTALAVRIAEAEADAAGKLVDVERKRALPDLSVTAAQTRFREGGERAYNLGVSLSIPLFDRNRGGIRAANADQRAAEARLDQQRRDSEADACPPWPG
jgi:cobalt-zinc-cadmium efflux system outer membrane protein